MGEKNPNSTYDAKQRKIRHFIVGDVNDGADFSLEYIEMLIYKIAEWFASPECDRQYEEPKEEARKAVEDCLVARKKDGTPWRNAPITFHKRLKVRAGFDLEGMKGIPSPRNKSPRAVKARRREAREALRNIKELDPALYTFDEAEFRKKLEEDLLVTFPELDNPAHLPNLRSLTMYYAEREKIDRQLALGTTDAKRKVLLESLSKLEDLADTTMKRLGVHPDQVRKKIADQGASSVADLVALVSDDEDFKQREKTWALQLALQLYWMSEHNNGNNTGPQVHDFEIWHMTRSRPMKFKCRCGEEYTLVEGFEPHELLEYLKKEGVLVEEPVIPGLIHPDSLKGLSDMVKNESDGT